jgi:hypothetical protein
MKKIKPFAGAIAQRIFFPAILMLDFMRLRSSFGF